MIKSVRDWLNKTKLKAVTLGPVGIEIAESADRPITSADQALRSFVGSLLYCKERGLNLSHGRNGEEFVAELGRLAAFLSVHHALLPKTGWQEKFPEAYNAMLQAANTHFSTSQSIESERNLRRAVEAFLDAIDATLESFARV